MKFMHFKASCSYAALAAIMERNGVDTENSRRIIDLLLKLAHEDGYCVVVVTHDLDIAALADKVLRMRDGRITGE